jgi:hypothetical protein
MVDDTATGQDAQLKIEGTSDGSVREIAVTNVSWDREANMTDVQYNTSRSPRQVTTGLRYSGSFEYDGRDYTIQNEFLLNEETEAGIEKNRPREGITLVVTEEPDVNPGQKYVYKFTDVKVTGQSRDMPSDDVSSTSWDFVAENLSLSSVAI